MTCDSEFLESSRESKTAGKKLKKLCSDVGRRCRGVGVGVGVNMKEWGREFGSQDRDSKNRGGELTFKGSKGLGKG